MSDESKILQGQLKLAIETVQLQAQVLRCIAPVMDWLAGDACSFDHHGYCQTHGPMEDGKCLVSEWSKLKEEIQKR